MGLKENIKKMRTSQGKTLEDVAKYIGVARQTVQKYESGLVSNIPSSTIEKMAALFHCTPAYLMGWEEDPHGRAAESEKAVLTGQEQAHLKKYRALDAHSQKVVDLVLDAEYERTEQAKKPER